MPHCIQHIILLLCCFFLMTSCGGSGSESAGKADGPTIEVSNTDAPEEYIGYAFNEPDEIYTLPASLTELSGMQSIGKGLVACVQDEEGILFLLDLERKQIVQEIKWGEGGDYEGVAGDDKVLYVLQSNDIIYKVSDYLEEKAPKGEKLEIGIPKGCDAEGLFLQKKSERLLIACKEGSSGMRSVWAYSLKTKELGKEPYINIAQRSLEDHYITNDLDKFSLGLKKLLDAKGESGILAPSGIAIHPITEDFYIVSAGSNLLLVLSPEGVIKSMQELPASLFAHPESITFTESGDLLIGNEGKVGAAPTILYFKYQLERGKELVSEGVRE